MTTNTHNNTHSQSEYLFVYATLMRKANHPMHELIAEHSQYVGEATLSGHLYQIDYYPGVVAADSAESLVHGELYHISNSARLFAGLDDYEECSEAFPMPHEYARCQIAVTLTAQKQKVVAWVYTYEFSIEGKLRLMDGRFIRHD